MYCVDYFGFTMIYKPTDSRIHLPFQIPVEGMGNHG